MDDNISKLSKLDKSTMVNKSISSTQAQNNFGQILDDIIGHRTRYIVERRGVPQVIILSLDDFAHTLHDIYEQQQLVALLQEVRPEYRLGQVLTPPMEEPTGESQ